MNVLVLIFLIIIYICVLLLVSRVHFEKIFSKI